MTPAGCFAGWADATPLLVSTGGFIDCMIQFIEAQPGPCVGKGFTKEQYTSYHFSDVWGCTDPEAIAVVDAFFLSSHFLESFPVLPGALDGMRRLKEHYRLVIVTSRQHAIEDATRKWLSAHGFAELLDTGVVEG